LCKSGNDGQSKCFSCCKIINEKGNRYYRLIVTGFSHSGSGGPAYWKCLCDCGKEAIINGHNLRAKITRSCGCFREDISRELGKARTGSNNYMWNPNLNREYRQKKKTNIYNLFSFPVFERDNFICQISGIRGGGHLEAHHLDDQSTNPEKTFDISNGITITQDRHREFHSWLGGTRVPCTKQDMIDFCELFYPDAPFLKSL
jgi:hypothetical protein